MTYTARTACAVAALLAAGAVQADGLDRSGQPIGAIFNAPGTAELSFGRVFPELEGADIGGEGSYSIAEDYNQFGAAVTVGPADGPFSLTAILDQPFGVDVSYDDDPLSSNLGGTMADLESSAFSLVGRYQVTPRFSVFGGPRVQRVQADVALRGLAYGTAIVARGAVPVLVEDLQALAAAGAPNSAAVAEILGQAAAAPGGVEAVAVGVLTGDPAAQPFADALDAAGLGPDLFSAQFDFALNVFEFAGGGGYSVDVEDSTGVGYLVGAAYEIPDIALRASVTYFSEIDHDAFADESLALGGGLTSGDEFTFTTPEAINVDFQTGIAPGTLLLASYRFTEFNETDVVPPAFDADLVNLSAGHRYTLGVGRQFSDALSGSAIVTYEPEEGGLFSPLGPTDDLLGLTLGLRYATEAFDVSGGINYSRVGGATAEVGGRPVAEFDDGHAVGVGLRGVYRF